MSNMIALTGPWVERKRWPWLALALALLASQSAPATTTTIYKCFDQNLRLVYTDEPCKDGEKLDIRAGDADPSAVARLERERDALSQSAAQRIADERHIAAQRELAAWMAYPGGDQRPDDYLGALPTSDYGWMWWYPPFARAHPHPPRSQFPRATGPRRVVPAPPPAPRQRAL